MEDHNEMLFDKLKNTSDCMDMNIEKGASKCKANGLNDNHIIDHDEAKEAPDLQNIIQRVRKLPNITGKKQSKGIFSLLSVFTVRREYCSKQNDFRVLSNDVQKCIQVATRKEFHPTAVHFMFEKILTEVFFIRADKMELHIQNIMQYCEIFGVELPILDIGLNSAKKYMLLERAIKEPDCKIENLKNSVNHMFKMNKYLDLSENGHEAHILHYGIGAFYHKLTKLDTKNKASVVALAETLVYLGHNVKGYTTARLLRPKQHAKLVRSCLEKVHSIAIKHYSIAKAALDAEENDINVSYFYKNELEVLYPLMSMASVYTDFHGIGMDENRITVSADDITAAEHCLAKVELKLDSLNLVSNRFHSRYLLICSAVKFRKCQLEERQHNFEAGLKYLDCAIQNVESAIILVAHTDFQEIQFASPLNQFLCEYRELLKKKMFTFLNNQLFVYNSTTLTITPSTDDSSSVYDENETLNDLVNSDVCGDSSVSLSSDDLN